MAFAAQTRATLADLHQVEGNAELIDGRIVPLVPSGDAPSDAAFEIAVSLRGYAKAVGRGVAKADGVGYAVAKLPSGRESFSPDASYYVGARPVNRMRFIKGAPNFAAEVRSENDYGDAAELKMAAKRADYFAAGTLVVWDVDPVTRCIHVYRASDPTNPQTYRSGEIAEAEPAVPGWRMAVDDVFA
jgi:Uma2 family endonuclease